MKRKNMYLNFNSRQFLKTSLFIATSFLATACFQTNYTLKEDSPVLAGNTIDQFNQLNKYAPDSVNVNISYEYAEIAIQNTGEIDDAQKSKGTVTNWYFQGRMTDNQHFYQIVTYVPEQENDVRLAGTVITQGRKRITGYETCVPYGQFLLDEEKTLFEAAALNFSNFPRETQTDLYIRRFVSNDTDEDGRRLETSFYVALSDIDMTCDNYTEMLEDFDSSNRQIDRWRDQALRAFEIIG